MTCASARAAIGPSSKERTARVTMTIFTELLPGARQLRTPLAIGYLWILAGWINVPYISKSVHGNVLLQRSEAVVAHAPLGVDLLALSFGAYLLGLCFEVIDDIIINAAVGAVFILLAVVAIIAMMAILQRLYALVFLLLILQVLVLCVRSLKRKTSIWDEADQTIINASLPIRNNSYHAKESALKLLSPTYVVRNELIATKIDEILLAQPHVLTEFCESISITALRAACAEAGLGQGRTRFVPDNGQPISVVSAAKRSSVVAEDEQLLRTYLEHRMLASSEVRKAVTLRVINTADIRRIVNQALSEGIALIRAGKPKVFEQYDRTRSEGKFRCGVSAPLAAVLWSAFASLTHSGTLRALAATIPVFFIYYSGILKQQEAERIVVSCVDARVVKVRLDVSDAQLLRYRSSTNADQPSSDVRRLVENLRGRRVDSPPDSGAAEAEPDEPDRT